MNDQERKQTVQSALTDLRAAGGVGKYLAVQKLQAVLDDWGEPDSELKRLMDFEKEARAVLGGAYAIRPAAFNHPDGTPVMLRILDENNVLEVLGLKKK